MPEKVVREQNVLLPKKNFGSGYRKYVKVR